MRARKPAGWSTVAVGKLMGTSVQARLSLFARIVLPWNINYGELINFKFSKKLTLKSYYYEFVSAGMVLIIGFILIIFLSFDSP